MGHNTTRKLLTLLLGAQLLIVVCTISSAQTRRNSTKKGCSGRSLENLVVERVPPSWPPEKNMRVAGDVVVKATIDETGKIVSARAICGHPLKRSSAISAVREWKFRPYTAGGKAHRVSGILTVHFPVEGTARNENEERNRQLSRRGNAERRSRNFRLKESVG